MTDRPSILIVEARFYSDIADQLVAGAISALDGTGFEYERLKVPGVFELPAAICMALRSIAIDSSSSPYAGFIAFGCVIRGETDHYDHVCRESSRALMDLATENAIALGFGILTCENRAQAEARAAVDSKNKGGEAAEACLRMIDVKRHFRLIER